MEFYRDKEGQKEESTFYIIDNDRIVVAVYFESDGITIKKDMHPHMSFKVFKEFSNKISEKELDSNVKQAFVRGVFGEKE